MTNFTVRQTAWWDREKPGDIELTPIDSPDWKKDFRFLWTRLFANGLYRYIDIEKDKWMDANGNPNEDLLDILKVVLSYCMTN